jgi:hypothetical protein
MIGTITLAKIDELTRSRGRLGIYDLPFSHEAAE